MSKRSSSYRPTSKVDKKKSSKAAGKKTIQSSKLNKNHAGEYAFKTLSDNNFRLQSERVFLTYKHHIDFDKLLDFIKSKHPIKNYIICHELGDEQHNYPHTHVSIEFQNKIDVRDCRKFDFDYNGEVIHPNIGTTRNWPASCIYCLKIWKKNPTEENKNWKSNFDVLEFLKQNKRNKAVKELNIKDLCNRIEKYNSVTETFQNEATSLQDIHALKMLYDNKRQLIDPKLIKYLEKWEKTMRPWQKQLFDILQKPCKMRKVYWVYDKIGKQGKSQLCDYVELLKMKDKCLVINATGSIRDIADIIRNWMKNGGSPEVILLDIPRTFKDRESIYTMIECIKGGRITCTKYAGTTLNFYPPHLMVFANWAPDIESDYLSPDRWTVIHLVATKINDKDAVLKRVNINTIKKNELDLGLEEIDFENDSEYDSINDSDNDDMESSMDFSFDENDFIDDLVITKKNTKSNKHICFLCDKSFEISKGMLKPWGSVYPACNKCVCRVNNLKTNKGKMYDSPHEAFFKLHKMSVADANKNFKSKNKCIEIIN
jgi:hypothetical protein